MTSTGLFTVRVATLVAALLLGWRVLYVNTVAYGDDGRPRLPAASVHALGPQGDDFILREALQRNPANVEALLLMAQGHEAKGESGPARDAYLTALQLAPFDREVLANGAQLLLKQGRTADALLLLDRLVDGYPEVRERVFPVIARIVAEGREPQAWNAVAARRPAWLGAFVVSSCERGVDPAILVPIFVGRIKSGVATTAEMACLVDHLRDADQWQQAYQLWLNTLPRERLADVGFVFNGGFEYAPSGTGFDWRPSRARERDSGHSVEMPQAAGVSGKRALRVTYNGKRQAGSPIVQYLAAPPGRYQLSGDAHPLSVTAGRGVQWTVRCVKAGQPQAVLAASERFVGSSEWRPFAFDVVVPADCPGQLLQLEPVGAADGPVYLAGAIWFDALVLRRH